MKRTYSLAEPLRTIATSAVKKKLSTSCRRHKSCLLYFLLFDFHLSGRPRRPYLTLRR